jgi:hypothetical protein
MQFLHRKPLSARMQTRLQRAMCVPVFMLWREMLLILENAKNKSILLLAPATARR